MNAFWHSLHFLHPQWLWLLAGVPLLIALAWRRGTAETALLRMVDESLLAHVIERHGVRRRWPLPAAVLGWILLSLAMAGPAWRKVPQPLYANQAAQVVALSLSRHMLVRDVTPDRLSRARYKIHALLDANADGQNGLVAYAGEAFTVAPLTSDAHALSDLLNDLDPGTMPVAGNDAAAAIQRGTKLLQHAGRAHGSLVLVTDSAAAHAVSAARAAHAEGVRVSVLGVGTAQGGPVPQARGGFVRNAQGNIRMAKRDDHMLRKLAKAGGGVYAPMTDGPADIRTLKHMLRSHLADTSTDQASHTRWVDEGPWLLLGLLPLAALMFRRGWLLLLPLMVMPLWPQPAQAGTFSNLWRRPDQQAAQALKEGHPKRAQQLARSPQWRGAAAYRAKDYAAAIRAFDAQHDPRAQYNLGNALARAGHYQAAIKAYDAALKADPGNADAAANRRAVRDWLRKQRKKHKPKGGKNGKQQKGGHDQSGSKGQNGAHDGSQPAHADTQGHSSRNGHAHQNRQHQGETSAATADQARKQQAQARKARKALKARMDQALGHGGRKSSKAYALGQSRKQGAGNKRRLPDSMEKSLQRVPDDPGGLLRRKFQLEYQQRHGGGGQ